MSIRIKESVFQKAFVAKMRLKCSEKLVVCNVENETNKSKAFSFTTYGYLMGKLWGVSDLIIFDKSKKGQREIIFIEMKAYNILKNGKYSIAGKQKPNQKIFQKLVEWMGFEYILMWNPDQMLDFIKKYLDN